MVGTSKILTVSYGTFSCTLEGFDDPFSTMRGIAEYFRDLAADDRYFGAEPPTPDAEMLHRIAEREINRRVIARVDGNGVTLRQMEDDEEDAAESAVPPESEAEPAQTKKKRKKDKARARALALGDTTPEPEPKAPAALAAPMTEAVSAPRPAESPESFAAKMLRIRAAVARTAAADAFMEDAQQEDLLGFKPISSAFEDAPAARDPVAETEAEPEVEAVAESADRQVVAEAEPEAGPIESESLADALADAAGGAEADAAVLQTAMAVEAAAAEATEADAEIADAEAEAAAPNEAPAAIAAASEDDDTDDTDDTEVASDDADLATLIGRVSESAEETDESMTEVEVQIFGRFEVEAEIIPTARVEIPPEPAPAPRLVRARVIKMRKPSIDREAEDFAEADDLPPMPVLANDHDEDDDDEDGLFSIADAVARAVQDDDADDLDDDDASLFADHDGAEPDIAGSGKDETADEDDFLADGPDQGADSAKGDADESDDEDEDETPLALTGSTLPDDEEADLLAELAEVEADHAFDAELASSSAEDAAPGQTFDGAPDADDGQDARIAALFAEADEDEADDDETEADAADRDAATADPEFEAPVHPAAAEASRHGRDGKARLDKARAGDDDASVRRILDETNSQLDDTEASRRRSTIAHLKAAVAATRADRDEKGDEVEPDEDMSQYRSDLERVVRPRRPGERATGTTRRLAPLMLVSEQRIDLPKFDLGSDVSVRPRRITTGNLALMEDEHLDDDDLAADDHAINDSMSFEDYAEKMGATELPDLLEAAAAYAAFVEGRPHFSRPQLMKTAMEAARGEISREDGLRSFGTLLRTGKIQKIKRGQFTIAKNSRFRPESTQL